jgi:hypothetical protein
LHGVDLAVPSYEGRIFLDNPGADASTPLTDDERYVGSFHVFGKVDCWGEDDEHCAPATRRGFDRRRPPNRLAKVRLRTREGLLRGLLERLGDEATLNVVAVLPPHPDYRERTPEDALRFERIAIVTYA